MASDEIWFIKFYCMPYIRHFTCNEVEKNQHSFGSVAEYVSKPTITLLSFNASANVYWSLPRNMWNVWRTVLEENEKLARARLAAVEVFQQQIADEAKFLRQHKLNVAKKVCTRINEML